MNITHMKYVITAAQYLNFSKAADQLYISQPALSRKIATIEKEFNMKLFERDSKKVKITPAGSVIVQEFQKIYDDFNLAIAKAQNINSGLSGKLEIGILDGEEVGDLFPPVLQHFDKHYPNLEISLKNYSFKGLVKRLYDGRLDLAITLYFDIKKRCNLKYQIIEETTDNLVVKDTHLFAYKEDIQLRDFKNDTFIMTSPEDSEESSRLIIDACKQQGFTPNIRFAPSIQTVMLWVESGVGVAILDSRNILRNNPSVKFLNINPISEPHLSLVWHQDNKNQARAIFKDIFLE